MILDSVNKSAEVKLDEATVTTECDITASYADITTSTFVPGASDTTTNGTTAVTAVAAPTGVSSRQVKEITVYNADSVTHNIRLQLNNNGTIRVVLDREAAPGESVIYRPDALQGPAGADGAVGATGAAAGTAGTPADFGVFFQGQPGASQYIFRMILSEAIDMPINLTGSQFNVRVAPTSNYDVTIKQNGASIGTIRFAATTGTPTITFAAAVALSPGDLFDLIGQSSTDPTMTDMSFSFKTTFA